MANHHSNQGYLPDSYRVPSHSNGAYNHIYTTTTPHRTTSRAYASSAYANSSSAASSSSSDGDDDGSDTDSYDSELLELQAAEREWEENVRQLQLAVSVLILPTIGKWLGRRWSYFCRCLSPRFTSVSFFRQDIIKLMHSVVTSLQYMLDTSKSDGHGLFCFPRHG